MPKDSRRSLIAGALSSLLASLSASASTRQDPAILRTDNERLILTEYTFQPGAPVKLKPRIHDQLILFIDDCRYERTDPASGLKSLRIRKAGDFIWYDRGGDSATVLNVGSTPFRFMLIELK
jgi:hypothetical protein